MDGLERVTSNHEAWKQRRRQELASRAGAVSLGGVGVALLSVAAGLFVAARAADADVAAAYDAGQAASLDSACVDCAALDHAWSQNVASVQRRDALRTAGAVSAGLGALGLSISIHLQGRTTKRVARLGDWDMSWQP